MADNDTYSGFKKFVKTTTRIIDKISVTTTGNIGFSTSFSHEHMLNKFSGVVLYWNSYTREIGLQFSNREGDDVMKLSPNKNGYGYSVSAKTFFLLNKIDVKKENGRYNYRTISLREIGIDEAGTMFIFKLEEG